MPDDVKQAISDNAKGPSEVSADGVVAKQHSLRDQIEADRHLASNDAVKKKQRGLSFTKLISPPATS